MPDMISDVDINLFHISSSPAIQSQLFIIDTHCLFCTKKSSQLPSIFIFRTPSWSMTQSISAFMSPPSNIIQFILLSIPLLLIDINPPDQNNLLISSVSILLLIWRPILSAT